MRNLDKTKQTTSWRCSIGPARKTPRYFNLPKDPRYDEYPTAVNENWVTVHSHTATPQKLFYPPGANLSVSDVLQQLQTVGGRPYGTCALFQWCPQARRMYQLAESWPLQCGSEVTIASVKRQAGRHSGSLRNAPSSSPVPQCAEDYIHCGSSSDKQADSAADFAERDSKND